MTACMPCVRAWLQVEGDGVIGKYPELTPDGEEFVYQSCTYQKAARGSMEGSFEFVEGVMDAPTGPTWDVLCPNFKLEIPDYIF